MSMREPVFSQENQGSTNPVRPFGIRDKFGYLLGDFGNDFFFLLTSAFLMVFYTDIFHISAATVGVMFMGRIRGCSLGPIHRYTPSNKAW